LGCEDFILAPLLYTARSVVYITCRVSGELYFVIGRAHEILGAFKDFMSARSRLHAGRGHYILRSDGAVLAYMSRESGNRMPAKIPKELKRQVALWAGVKKVSHPGLQHEEARPASEIPHPNQDS